MKLMRFSYIVQIHLGLHSMRGPYNAILYMVCAYELQGSLLINPIVECVTHCVYNTWVPCGTSFASAKAQEVSAIDPVILQDQALPKAWAPASVLNKIPSRK
jgi:hypothetical protein